MSAADAEPPAARPRRRRRRLRLVLAALAALALLVVAAQRVSLGGGEGAAQGGFYEPPEPLPNAPPGTILRTQAIAAPAGSRAWRILYLSRGHGGDAAALSALLLVPARPARSGGRNVVAVLHGSVGVVPRCGVSVGPTPWPHVDGLARFVKAGYAVVVPDFEGLGTSGPLPYLHGRAEARATLDAVRATHLFEPAAASLRVVAWGTGQGGRAALHTGREAARVAPEVELAGVAAGAPATDLGRLLDANRATPYGRLLAAHMVAAWNALAPQLRLEDVVAPASRRLVNRLAGTCVASDRETIPPAVAAMAGDVRYVRARPWETQPWKRLLEQADVGGAIPVPVIVTQGADDAIVRPALTRRLVRRLCAGGVSVQYRPSRKVGHVDVGPKTAPYVSHWIASRFAGARARSTCR